jgi:hypothetical protein
MMKITVRHLVLATAWAPAIISESARAILAAIIGWSSLDRADHPDFPPKVDAGGKFLAARGHDFTAHAPRPRLLGVKNNLVALNSRLLWRWFATRNALLNSAKNCRR